MHQQTSHSNTAQSHRGTHYQLGGVADPWADDNYGNPFRNGNSYGAEGDYGADNGEDERFDSFMQEGQFGGADLAANNARFAQLVAEADRLNQQVGRLQQQYGHQNGGQRGGANAGRSEILKLYQEMGSQIRQKYADRAQAAIKSGKKVSPQEQKISPGMAMKVAKLALIDARKALKKETNSPDVVKEALSMADRRMDHYIKAGQDEMDQKKRDKETRQRKRADAARAKEEKRRR